MGRNKEKVKAAIFLLWILLMMVACGVSMSHAAVPHKHENSLGVVIPFDNPNSYIYGAVVSGTYISYNNKIGTVVRFQPFHTFSLFTSELLFCGNEGSSFEGMSGPIVVTYETVAHETIDGIGCHNLVSVNKVVPRTELP